MFFTQNGDVPPSIPYPTISYPVESPLYGGFGEFSYTDSSPDISPTIAHFWPGMDDETYNNYEKHFINSDRDNIETQQRIEQNRENLEHSLNINNNCTEKTNTRKNTGNLTTINEETGNILENPRD